VVEPFAPGVAARFIPVPLTRSRTSAPLAARPSIVPPLGTAKPVARALPASASTSPRPGIRPDSSATVLTGADASAVPASSTSWGPAADAAVVA